MDILVLEDDSTRQKAFRQNLIGANVVIVDTPQEAIKNLDTKTWDFLFLDHDLGGQSWVTPGDDTGYAVAKWLEANPSKQPKAIVLHTLNPIGGKAMKEVLPNAVYAPGCWSVLQLQDNPDA